MIKIRDTREEDAEEICEVFQATYGKDYTYPQFLDPQFIRKLVHSDDTIMIVAEDTEEKRIVGTASVLEEKGAYSDLVGEFGRLVVHPDARNRGIGKLLMKGRVERVQERLHVGLVEARMVHSYSSKIAMAHGFTPIGFLPSYMEMSFRENVGVLSQYFGNALSLRKNHPRIIPEAYPIAQMVADRVGLSFHGIVDEESASYPHNDDFSVEGMTTQGYASLLRIERGRVKHREIFGPMQLHYGFFKIRAKNSNYLLAFDKGQLVGAIGFTMDTLDKKVRVFELISMHDEVIRFLIRKLVETCRENTEILFFEIDVSAYAPRMQRTLLELEFLPAAYIPALVFYQVERLDIIKMVRIFSPIDISRDIFVDEFKPIVETVVRSFESVQIQPRILEAMGDVVAFSELTEEQRKRVASCCDFQQFSKGEKIFLEGSMDEKIFLLLKGSVEIQTKGEPKPMVTVEKGECLGEVSTLAGVTHSATAIAKTNVEAAVLLRKELEKLIRRRPDIGVSVYRNLAIGLGKKLRRSGSIRLNSSSP